MSPCNQQGLKPEVLKVSRLGWDRAQRALCCSRREGRKTAWGQTAWKEPSEKMPGTWEVGGGEIPFPV